MIKHIGAKIILGAVGGILFGFGVRDILFTYLPSELQAPAATVALGFIILLIAAKVK